MKRNSPEDFEFGRRLKNFRMAKGFSAEELARKIGVATSTYRDWEYGRAITGQPYVKMAKLLGISVYQLLGIEEASSKQILERLSEIEEIVKELKLSL